MDRCSKKHQILKTLTGLAFLAVTSFSYAGNFYTNIVLKTSKEKEVEAFLHHNKYDAYVSPETNGFIVVYEKKSDTQDTDFFEGLTQNISKTLQCLAVAFLNHDDDILWFRVYSSGKLIDTYDSAPAYFQAKREKPAGGDATNICKLFSCNSDEVEKILRQEDYVFEYKRHRDLVRLLNLPEFTVGYGYNYINQGEIPKELKMFKHIQKIN